MTCSRSIGKAYFCYVGRVLISSSRDSHCRLEKFAPLGQREAFRTLAGGPLRAWARPVNAPERSAAVRRSALLGERGLTGWDPRPYPFPASEWLGPVAAKSTADALPVRSCERFSDSLRDYRTRRSQSSKPPIVLVVFHRELCSEFAARVALRASVHSPTDAGQSPDAHRTAAHAAATVSIPHLRATFDGSTRLRTERRRAPGGNPLVLAATQLPCFQ